MTRRLIFFLVMLLIVLPVTAGLFFTSKSYPKRYSGQPLIADSYVIEEGLPDQIASRIFSHIDRYNQRQKTKEESFTILDAKIERSDKGYYFILEPASGAENLLVEADVENYGNFFSIKVRIGGEEQGII